jgi:hypothetical protein
MQTETNSSDKVLDWLLEPNQPVVRYFALTELLDRPKDDPEALEAYSAIAQRGWAFDLFSSQNSDGSWESSESLYVPKYTATNWRAIVLSDFGLTKKDPRLARAAELFLDRWLDSENKDNIFHDDVCVVGNTARMLTRFGYEEDPRVQKLFERLVEDQKEDGGWHCFESKTGTLDCWEALAAYASLPESKRTAKIKSSLERGAEFYLERRLYDDGEKKYLPWFRFHYPVHYYYDLLVGLDVLTSLGYGGDSRLEPALNILREKQMTNGTWMVEKIHPDLGEGANYGPFKTQPRPFVVEKEGEPSKWLTLKAKLVEKRVKESSAG